jgi:hypothetical protein
MTMSASVSNQHGGDEEWLDYARALGERGRREELSSHLAQGCTSCTEVLALWRSVSDVASREAAHRPPDSIVRQARGAFAIVGAAAPRRGLAAILTFDSFLQPSPAGVRAASRGARHLLYKAGRYVIRLRAEDTGAGQVSIVGQVVDEELPGTFLPEVTVMAFTGKKAIDQTVTNRLGEFAFDAAPAGGLQLAVGLAENAFMTVALPVAPSGDDTPTTRAKRLNWK